MIWLIFALLSAFFDSTYYMLNKKLVEKLDVYFVPACVFSVSFLVMIPLILIKGMPQLNTTFFIAILITSVLNVLAIVLYLSALKTTDISLCMPMMSFTPLFLILTSYLILDEFPSYFGIAGIFLIVSGSYIMGLKRKKAGILAPLKNLLKNKGAVYILLVAFIFSIALNFDKMAVVNSDPLLALAGKSFVLGVSFMIISSFKSAKKAEMLRLNWKMFLLTGIVLVLVDICINIAYTLTLASYAIAIKRLSIMFTMFYGYFVFREKNIRQRAFAAFVMFLGVVLIAVS